MSFWWQDLTTGEIFERPDHATCRREALDRLAQQPTHYVYISRSRIPEGHGQWWRDAGCPERLDVRSSVWPRDWGEDLPAQQEPQTTEMIWGA